MFHRRRQRQRRKVYHNRSESKSFLFSQIYAAAAAVELKLIARPCGKAFVSVGSRSSGPPPREKEKRIDIAPV
jgi:hypothetical protein